ncbi:CDC42 small effector protein 2-like [Tubulanus polymorphus]|uniref:CDC42 small effector protein 2-like n=1 Tax=Tubulanus polymorphus TaxID=672921 RepID=UPI003DA1E624
MSEVMVCFRCCITQQPQPKRRRRIDRSMIGQPTDFRHTGHIGSGDMENGAGPHKTNFSSLQTQMSGKGGYNAVAPVNVQIKVIDLSPQPMTTVAS